MFERLVPLQREILPLPAICTYHSGVSFVSELARSAVAFLAVLFFVCLLFLRLCRKGSRKIDKTHGKEFPRVTITPEQAGRQRDLICLLSIFNSCWP